MLFNQERVGLALAAAAEVAQTLLDERAAKAPTRSARRDGWRSHGVVTRRFAFEFHGEQAQAGLTYLHDGALSLHGGRSGRLCSSSPPRQRGIDLRFAGQRAAGHGLSPGRGGACVHTAQGATQIIAIDLLATPAKRHAEVGRLTAPMPGKVVSFAVKAGDKVKQGQALAVMEAMKMEHTIAAPADGVVAELLYAPGDQVAEGAELLKLVVRSDQAVIASEARQSMSV